MKRLKSGEKICGIEKLEDREYLVLQFREHGPWCGGQCLAEGGCSGAFFQEDIDGGTIMEVYMYPERFVLLKDYNGEPLKIVKLWGL